MTCMKRLASRLRKRLESGTLTWYGWVRLVAAVSFIALPLTQAHAEIVFIGWGAPAELRLQVGSPSGVSTVVHDVPAAHIGDATPVTGAPNSILIDAYARMPNIIQAIFTQFIISVDSSIPLSNGGYTIPFTDISWTAQHGDIPSGVFQGIPGQVVAGPTRAFYRLRDWHTFSYNNTRVLPAGIYSGRVTYTVSIP